MLKISISQNNDLQLLLLGANGVFKDGDSVISPITGAKASRDGYIDVYFANSWVEIPFNRLLNVYSTTNSKELVEYMAENSFFNSGGSLALPIAQSDVSGLIDRLLSIENYQVSEIVFVDDISKLPAEQGGVIDLGDLRKWYIFTNQIDLGGLIVDFGNNSISASSQENAGISNAIIEIDQSCTVKYIRLENVSMSINTPNGAFDWQFVNFYDSDNIDIQNADNIVWQTFGFINTYNVQLTGTVDSIVIAPNCIWRSVTEQICDLFAIRSGAVVNRRVRIEDSVFSTDFATQNPINVEFGASIPIEGFRLEDVVFSGSGSIQGTNGGDDISWFRGCNGDNVINSTAIANMYITNNQIPTPTPIQGDKYKVVATTQLGVDIQRFLHDPLNNTLEYTSSVSRIFKVLMPYTVFAGNNNVVGVYIAVTRFGDVENPNNDVIPESEMYTTTNGTRPISGSSQCILTLSKGDKIYMAVENEDGTSVRTEFSNMIVETANT